MSSSLSSRIVPAVLEWMFEQDDRVYVLFAPDLHGSSLTPKPNSPFPTSDLNIVSPQGEINIKLLKLNISSEATSGFAMLDDGLSFKCRFSGQPIDVFVSYDSVVRLECPSQAIKYDFPFVPPEMVDEKKVAEETTDEQVKVSRPKLTLVK